MHLDHFKDCNMYILVYIMYIFPDANDSSNGFLRRKRAASTSVSTSPRSKILRSYEAMISDSRGKWMILYICLDILI